MGNLDYQFFYRRNLPHYQPPGATLFMTFRLAGSMPKEVLDRLIEEAERIDKELAGITDKYEQTRRADFEQQRLFEKWDKALDTPTAGPMWLKEHRIATLVAESLHYRDKEVYDLDAYCIMSNHVHVVCKPLEISDGGFQPISKIMHSLKRHSARQANLILEREGEFWQHENYDHAVRSEAELSRIIQYVVNNPVQAGLAEKPKDWKWTYSK
jgi:putative transposase